MSVPCVHIIFKSELPRVKEVVTCIEYCMATRSPYITKDDMDELRLIFSELLINAVIHGNHQDASKKVELWIDLRVDAVVSVIRDEGCGFDFNTELNRKRSHMSEQGRGLMLVSSLTENLHFNETGNEVTFSKPLMENHARQERVS